MTIPQDAELAKKYGGYLSFETETAPYKVEHYGESENDDFDRLLKFHVHSQARVLDIGCGAGQITCEWAAHAGEIWGVDEVGDMVEAAAARAQQLGLNNAHFLHGEKRAPHILAALPDGFDVIYSRRGPNLDEKLAEKLKIGGIFLQLLVSEFDGYPLKEIFGRRAYSPFNFADEYALLAEYARFGMQPISVKTYWYEIFFRNIEHLETFLTNIPANLSDWRIEDLPYDPKRDRAALELYARYNSTSDGIRLLRHRRVIAVRKVEINYPIAAHLA